MQHQAVTTREAHRIRRRRSPAACRGYTLIEVLVVVAIVGLVGAIIVPHMLQAGTLGVQAAARMVIADLLYAQNEAVAHQSARRVIFEPQQNRYRLVRLNADGQEIALKVDWKTHAGGDREFMTDFGSDSRFQGVTLQNVSFGSGNAVTFDELGSPDVGGSVDLTYNDQTYRITVASFTGRVTVARIHPGGN